MPFSKVKRARLVTLIGEARVRQLEHDLPAAEKMLEEAGIGWKEVGEPVMVEAAPRPLGGATSFAEVDVWQKASAQKFEIVDLTDVFSLVVSNVLADDVLDTRGKSALLEKAADDFGDRLGELSEAEKALLEARLPQAGEQIVYGDKLLGEKTLGILSRSPEGRKASGPAAAYVADLIAMLQGPQAVEGAKGAKGEPPEGPAGYIDDLRKHGAVRG